MRILIVEDEQDLAETLTTGLRAEGFAVDAVTDGAAALTFLGDHEVDVMILDRDLPGMSGDAVCRALTTIDHPVRILMLTAAGTLSDRVAGFELGADDYLPKPFAYLELLARIRALGRRGAGTNRSLILEHAGVRLDPTRRLAERDGRPLRLTPKELGVLQVLLESRGGVVTPAELLDQVWTDDDRSRGVVKVVVHALRRKLGEPSVIVTEAGLGYRLG